MCIYVGFYMCTQIGELLIQVRLNVKKGSVYLTHTNLHIFTTVALRCPAGLPLFVPPCVVHLCVPRAHTGGSCPHEAYSLVGATHG